MADPTCQNCPPEKRIERYSSPRHDSSSGEVIGIIHIARCIECGNQLVDDEPNNGPNMPTVFEETVNGGERVIRKQKSRVAHGPPAGKIR